MTRFCSFLLCSVWLSLFFHFVISVYQLYKMLVCVSFPAAFLHASSFYLAPCPLSGNSSSALMSPFLDSTGWGGCAALVFLSLLISVNVTVCGSVRIPLKCQSFVLAGEIIFHCVYIHFLYLLICSWAPRLVPCLGFYYKLCCDKHDVQVSLWWLTLILSGAYQVVAQLNQMVALCLVFWGTSTHISTVAVY